MVRSIGSYFPLQTAQSISFIKTAQDKIFEVLTRIFEAPAGFFLKICVFRGAALNDRFSQMVTLPVVLAIENYWKKTQGIPSFESFDAARLEKSAVFLRAFAEVRTFKTEDGKVLSWSLYRPEKFDQWITANGGIRLGQWILPRNAKDWERLKRLNEFKWFKQVGQAFQVPAKVLGAENSCVLRCQGFGRTMPMDKAFIGMHLASGFNYAHFDWREELSIEGFAKDAEGCYQALLSDGFSPSQIKIMASCRGTFPAVQLKERHHKEGVDAVLIQPPPSLHGVIANQMPPSNQIGLMGIGTIENRGHHYDSVRRLKSLPPGGGRVCLIVSEGDKTLPKDTEEQFRNAVGRAGPFYTIREPKREGEADPHFEEPLRKSEIWQRYAEFLAGRIP